MFLKLLKWAAIAWFLVIALFQLSAGNTFGAFAFSMVAFACWAAPRLLRGKKLTAPPSSSEFNPTLAHDNIALDADRDMLWIRDVSGAARYVRRGELLSWKTDSALTGRMLHHQIHLQVRDVQQPLWRVEFKRHAEGWKHSAKRNSEERSEWFARIQAWDATPAQSAAPGLDNDEVTREHLMSFIRLHRDAGSSQGKESALEAFNVISKGRGWDPREEWERFGGTYPG